MDDMQSTDSNKTRVDRYVAFLKNHKIFSVAFILALGIIAVASVLKSSHEIISFFSSDDASPSNIDKIARSMNPGLNVVIVLPDMDYEGSDKDLDIAISLKLTLEKSGKTIVIKKKDIDFTEQQVQSLRIEPEFSSARADYVVFVRNGVAKVVNGSSAEVVYMGEAYANPH